MTWPAKTKTYPALTSEEFNSGCGYTFRGVPICETESADYVIAYGHIDPETFLAAVLDYDTEVCGEPDSLYEISDARHVWAVTVLPADHVDGWRCSWEVDGLPVTSETPDAFALTVVNR